MRFVILLVACALLAGCSAAPAPDQLPGTSPLVSSGSEIATEMIDGMHRFLDRKLEQSADWRKQNFKPDTSSPQAYAKSLGPHRAKLAAMLGVVDPRVPFKTPELVAALGQPSLVGRGFNFDIIAVRWPVIDGVWGEGLLLRPTGREPTADVICLHDSDRTVEGAAGLLGAPGIAQSLAERGFRVLVPALVNREHTWSQPPSGQKTNQPHREYVYRPAFQMGRHIIGYEVQKVLAAVDWMDRERQGSKRKIVLVGLCEGGILGLYAAALDDRIDDAALALSFGIREPLHEQPIYRNVFGLLKTFGEAELAAMVCPRRLVIDTRNAFVNRELPEPVPPFRGAAPHGSCRVSEAVTESAIARARELTAGLPPEWLVAGKAAGFEDSFLDAVGVPPVKLPDDAPHFEFNYKPDDSARQQRLVSQMIDHTQRLVRDSERTTRKAYWAAAPPVGKTPAGQWHAALAGYRDRFEREHLGKFDEALLPPNAKTRKLFETDKVTGYGVKLDVFDGVPAYGILCLPKDLKPGERRPVVVCQHGLNGAPTDVSDPAVNNKFYNQFGLRLAERGYITFAPQNPYVLDERFRYLVRKANPLGYTLWSFIVPQHRQITDWLAKQPFVDPDRIAFYGLSYGGKTAMRVPAVVNRYYLSICSGDFNEWTWKTTSLTFASGYPGTHEYEIFEWNLGNTFGYYEMAMLIAPRPFMVERGHRDGVAPDEWVAYEYAKVRRLYADLKIPERTTIEFFDGPHTIHGVGTFEFLDQYLKRR